MSDPYLGEIKLVSFNFPPKGWAFCNGQVLAIQQNQALFSLLGTIYGGNGVTTFALPNLQGRMPMHWGGNYVIGQSAGEYAHTLTISEIPAHTHVPLASTATGTAVSPAGNVWAGNVSGAYASAGNGVMSSLAVGNVGGSQPHTNMSPYLAVYFVIALTGIFPSRN